VDNNSVFAIVTDVIGEENALKLQELCGGMIFYIPVREARYTKVLNEYNRLLSVGEIPRLAIIRLSMQYSTPVKTIKRQLQRALQCQS
jgi:hypothetical protein